ncbi:hypothetical protein B0H14DRAFT_2563283 [Mycena olivaceomarginata]|nr:hypothetical protein B0H14DRAFT_2563283 [Mycena olivaceomarginata]
MTIPFSGAAPYLDLGSLALCSLPSLAEEPILLVLSGCASDRDLGMEPMVTRLKRKSCVQLMAGNNICAPRSLGRAHYLRVQLTIYAGFGSCMQIIFLHLEARVVLLRRIIFYTLDARVQLIDLPVHDNINCWVQLTTGNTILGPRSLGLAAHKHNILDPGFSSSQEILFLALEAWAYSGFSSSREIIFLALEPWAQLLAGIIFYTLDTRVQLINLGVQT